MQPNLLHVTIMNGSERKAAWKSTLTDRDWRVQLRIRQGRAFLLLHGEEAEEKPIDCVRDGRVALGAGGLLLTIITPLQDDKRGGPDGVRIVDVVRRRMEEEPRDKYPPELVGAGEEGARKITQQFISKKANPEAKIEMHRCRIRAEFLASDGMTPLSAPVLSADVCNSRHNDVGALELHEMSDPRASCTRGGFKVLLSSEFKAPTLKKGASSASNSSSHPIHAVFVVTRGGEPVHAEAAYPEFTQISLSKENFQIHHNTLAFLVPSQSPQVVRAMQRVGETPRVALYRPHDNKYSQTQFDFKYVEHRDDGDCHFCAILRPSELRKYVRARKDHRRRVTDAGNGNGNNGTNSSGGGAPPPGNSGSRGAGGGARGDGGGGVGESGQNFLGFGVGSYGGGGEGSGGNPYSPTGSSTTSGVYSPGSISSSSNNDFDAYFDSPASKCRRVSADATSNSSNSSNEEGSIPPNCNSFQDLQSIHPIIQVQPPQLEQVKEQQQQQQEDNFVLEDIISEAAASHAMSPNSGLPAAESMDTAVINSSIQIVPPKTVTDPHQQFCGEFNLDDLTTMDFSTLLSSEAVLMAHDGQDGGGLDSLDLIPREEVRRMQRRRGEKEAAATASGSSDEGVDVVMDGDQSGLESLERPPDEIVQRLMARDKEKEMEKEKEQQKKGADKQRLANKEAEVGQRVLSRRLEELDLNAVDGDVRVDSVRQEDGAWLKALAVGIMGVFLYELIRIATDFNM